LEYYFKKKFLFPSEQLPLYQGEEEETGSAGEQPVSNTLPALRSNN
jgi:hypothetical protein